MTDAEKIAILRDHIHDDHGKKAPKNEALFDLRMFHNGLHGWKVETNGHGWKVETNG